MNGIFDHTQINSKRETQHACTKHHQAHTHTHAHTELHRRHIPLQHNRVGYDYALLNYIKTQFTPRTHIHTPHNTHIHPPTYTYIHTHIHIHPHTYTYIHTHIHIHILSHTHMPQRQLLPWPHSVTTTGTCLATGLTVSSQQDCLLHALLAYECQTAPLWPRASA